MKFDLDIDRIYGIVGMTIAYQYGIGYEPLCEYIENTIDNNTDLVYKISDSDNNFFRIKNREEFEEFKKHYGVNSLQKEN